MKQQAFGGALKKNLIALCGIMPMLSISIGYRSKVSTYRENLNSTCSDTNHMALKSLPKPNYSWYSIPMSEFHENYYKRYYGLEDVIIQYDTAQGA